MADTFSAAMVYVMLSRVCSLEQIFILNEFEESKMYPNMKALDELERLDKISINRNPTKWEDDSWETGKVISLIFRSLKKHYPDIITDALLLKSDLIGLQETWLENDQRRDNLEIPGYQLHLNSYGRGKGIATYYKSDIFSHVLDIKEENMQLSKFTSPDLDVIVIYRSQQGRQSELNQHLKQEGSRQTPQLVIGDFNFCYLDKSSNLTKSFLEGQNYYQLIKEPTHIEGQLLDQAYLRDLNKMLKTTGESQSKYYTDHKGLAITLSKVREGKVY